MIIYMKTTTDIALGVPRRNYCRAETCQQAARRATQWAAHSKRVNGIADAAYDRPGRRGELYW